MFFLLVGGCFDVVVGEVRVGRMCLLNGIPGYKWYVVCK